MISKSIAAEIQTTTAERGCFSYGAETIHYDIIRKAENAESKYGRTQARKVVIKVHPDQRVVATVPFDASDESIKDAMIKRARWIWESICEFSAQHEYVMPRQYISGETQFYLGRRYVLKVIIDAEKVANVKLHRGKLTVTLKKDCDDRVVEVKALLDRWYTRKAEAIFNERLQAMLPKASWVKGLPRFRIMAMTKQWGSCSSKGNLMLNPHLVKAPKECIDYVILHELCHIAEHNHSDKFWRLLTQVMPNWKEVKAKLDDMAELYLN
ncbi:M48 family metallopeptidase [Pseudoalteromonas aurantia]|uniref:M48 family peptidase n=1 Tax=Pseudoalteromonas aurantia TaxID=43654 RepID=A0A5S3V287_9GAMM|nr:SprT family zinc-dependent metalloprotease [Pseudoalteromonas aurantia]TMO64860.1 M48 family peptidase [Pseudoalteromonas aurantia]